MTRPLVWEAEEVVKVTPPRRGNVWRIEPMRFIPHNGKARP